MHRSNELGTGACTEHTHQVLTRAQSAIPSKHADHTGQELMRTLSIRVRIDAYPEHTGQRLMRTLSIRISFLSVNSA